MAWGGCTSRPRAWARRTASAATRRSTTRSGRAGATTAPPSPSATTCGSRASTSARPATWPPSPTRPPSAAAAGPGRRSPTGTRGSPTCGCRSGQRCGPAAGRPTPSRRRGVADTVANTDVTGWTRRARCDSLPPDRHRPSATVANREPHESRGGTMSSRRVHARLRAVVAALGVAPIVALSVAAAPVTAGATGLTRDIARAGTVSFTAAPTGAVGGTAATELAGQGGAAAVVSHERSRAGAAPEVPTGDEGGGGGRDRAPALLASFDGLDQFQQRTANGGRQFTTEP